MQLTYMNHIINRLARLAEEYETEVSVRLSGVTLTVQPADTNNNNTPPVSHCHSSTTSCHHSRLQ